MKHFKNLFLFVMPFLLVDIITKQYIRINNIQTSGHFVDITYITNTGTLWSLFANANSVNLIFIGLSIIAIAALLWYYHKEQNQTFATSLLIAGILGNVIDRITQGSVIDWINFHFFPVFNFADSFIVSGVVLFILLQLREHKTTSTVITHKKKT